MIIKARDKYVGWAESIVTVFFVSLVLTSVAFALDSKYPAKVERVIDGDTIIADLIDYGD